MGLPAPEKGGKIVWGVGGGGVISYLPTMNESKNWLQRLRLRAAAALNQGEIVHGDLIRNVDEVLGIFQGNFDFPRLQKFSASTEQIGFLVDYGATKDVIHVSIEYQPNPPASVCRSKTDTQLLPAQVYLLSADDNLVVKHLHKGQSVSVDELSEVILHPILFPESDEELTKQSGYTK